MPKFLAAVAAALVAAALAAPVSMAQNQAGDSLVNVQVGDVTIQVPIAVAANLCDINVNILAQQLDDAAACTADADSIASPGGGTGGGGGNTAGNSLVNVQVGDITLQLPIAVAANVCDVSVNVLAQQDDDAAPCTATSDSSA